MKWVASLGGVGFLKPASGTWGSLAALVLAWIIASLGGFWLFLVLGILSFPLGLKATEAMIEGKADHDPSWIVIDELCGQWVALVPIVYGAAANGVDLLALWPGWLAAFVLFRLFDIWKPWLVGHFDRKGGALGVMMDDVVAGAFAALGVMLLAALFHRVIL